MAGDALSLLRKGNELRERGLYEDAIAVYDRVLRTRRRAVYVMLDRAFCLAKLGRRRAALKSCDDAYGIDAHSAQVLHKAIRVVSEAGMGDAAAKWYGRAYSLGSRDPGLLCEIGRFYSRSGDPAKAADCYGRAYDMRSDDVQILREVAGFYSRSGDPAKAADCVLRAQKAGHGDHGLWYDTARYMLDAGDLAEAAAYCNRALDAIPDDPMTTKLDARISAKNKQCCRNYEDPGVLLLLIPDTNWWLGFYSVEGGGPVKDELVGATEGDLRNRVRNGSLKITGTVRREFCGVIGDRIGGARKSGDKATTSRLEGSRESFLGLYKDDANAGMDTYDDHMYARANRTYAEIWEDHSTRAEDARKSWARVKNKGRVTSNPPQDEADQEILAEAGTLARLYRERRTVIVTADNDFLAFARWIWRRFGVCIKRSDRR